MIQAFDTINEYIQGPCFDNQIALFQANFLDMASNLLVVDEIMQDLDYNIQLAKDEEQVDELVILNDITIQVDRVV